MGELLDTTQFLFIKSFQLLDDGASAGCTQLRSSSLMKSSIQEWNLLRFVCSHSSILDISGRTVIGDPMEMH